MAYFIEREIEVDIFRYYVVHVDAYGMESKRQHIGGLVGVKGGDAIAYIFGYCGSFYIYVKQRLVKQKLVKQKLVKLEDDERGQLAIAHGAVGDIRIAYVSIDVYIQGTYVVMDAYRCSPLFLDMDSQQIVDHPVSQICEDAMSNVVVDGNVRYYYSGRRIEAWSATGRLWKRKVRLGNVMSAEMICNGIHVMWVPRCPIDGGNCLVYVDHRTFDFYHLRVSERLCGSNIEKITCQ